MKLKMMQKPLFNIFKSKGIKTVLLSGDNSTKVNEVGGKLSFDIVRSNQQPGEKISIY
jgi:cation transport ATPase